MPRLERKSLGFGCVSGGAPHLPRPGAHGDDHEHYGQHGEAYGRPQPPTEAAEECARPAFHQYSTLHLNYEVCTQIMSGC